MDDAENEHDNEGRGLAFAILGPLRVTRDGQPLALGGPQQRAVLGLLLIDADRRVPTERIADALWGEQPPAGYTTTIQTYVFHLREALEPGRAKGAPARVLVTERGGYRLDTTGCVLDSRVFEADLTAGQRDLHAEHYDRAVAHLDAALALWRGEVLSDVAELDAVTPVAARLTELRLAALEARVDAQLALGQHAMVAGELDALVTRYPLREHLHAQRMLALYRCGRQADALAAYRQLRDGLDRDIGVAPSPPLQHLHQQILNHDPQLAAPSPAREDSQHIDPSTREAEQHDADLAAAPLGEPRHSSAPAWRLGRWRIAIPVVVVLVAGGTAAAVVAANSPRSSLRALPGNSVGIINTDGTLHNPVTVGQGPTAVAYGDGSLWVTNSGSNTLSRIDPRTDTVIDQIPVGRDPTALAVTPTDVWVVNSDDGTVSRVNVEGASAVRATIKVGNEPDAIAYGTSGLWVANHGDDTIQHIDPAVGRIGPAIDVGGGPDGIAIAADAVWVANGLDGTVSQVDPATSKARVPVQVGAGPAGIMVAAGTVWVANSLEQSVSRIDETTGELVGAVRDVGDGPTALASDGRYVWASAAYSGEMVRIDPRSLAVARFRVGSSPDAVAAHGSTVYVAVQPFAAASHLGGTLKVGSASVLPGTFTGIDPANVYAAPTQQSERMVYDGLMAFRAAAGAAGFTLVPDLAAAMPTISQDGMTYTFTIRTGIRYSNGALVQPQDFVTGFTRVFTVGPGGNPAFFSAVLGASHCLSHPANCDLGHGVIADNTHHRLTINLARPDPDLLDELAYFVYPAPPHTSLKQLTSPLPGTGPYEIRAVRQVKIHGGPGTVFDLLVRNPYFHQWSFAAQPAGYPDQIQYQALPVTNATVAAAAVQARTIDVAQLFSQDVASLRRLIASLSVQYPTRVHSQVAAETDWQALNTRVPPFNNLLARKAINFAFDRQHFVDLAGGPGVASVTCQLLPPNFPSYTPYCPYTKKGPNYYNGPDLAEARRLVAQSGTFGMPVTVYGISSGPLNLAQIDYLASVTRELGYTVTVRGVPLSQSNYDYPLDSRHHVQAPGTFGWIADYPDPSNFYNSLLSCASFVPNSPNNGYNVSEYCNPALDRLAAAATAAARTDPGAARREWAELDHRLTDQAPIIAYENSEQTYFVSTRVENFQSNTWGPVLDQMWVK